MSRHARVLHLLCLVLAIALLASCSGKKRASPVPVAAPGEIADLRNFPQDLNAYAKGSRKPLMAPATQASQAARWQSRFFSPWHMSHPSVGKKEASTLLNAKARGWKDGHSRWTVEEWAGMRANADMASWPNACQPGITLRAANLREMPTATPRFVHPTPDVRKDPFDYFQYSLLPMGMPLYICHRSLDGRWLFVETPLVSGWMASADVAPVTPAFASQWEGTRLGCITKERTSLLGESVGIGTVLPLPSQGTVYMPVRGADGTAAVRSASCMDASPWPIVMTPASVAALGNQLLGQPYGWGGMLGLRDCSSLTRDLMTPYGIWLPRNSRPQARTGYPISLAGMSVPEKEACIMRSAVPFASLVGMNGHIMLYVGTCGNRPAILHDYWGVHVDEPADEDQRLVIGRVVVTSITPGRELPHLHEGRTIGDRMHTVTILGNAVN
jgi:hypothetical protein